MAMTAKQLVTGWMMSLFYPVTNCFTGYTEIWNLREEWKDQKGDAYDLREFHETILSYGSSPLKYIRELMLE